jgi:phosphoribosylamine--glycine ligase
MLNQFNISGHPYKGLLYVGLMISPQGEANVVEFNCRFGDPETQCVLRLLDEDLLLLMYQAATSSLETRSPKIKNGASAVVVLAAEGYPDLPKKGIKMHIPETTGSVKVFHAGTKRDGDEILSSGGRILGITAVSANLKQTIDMCYEYLSKLNIRDTFYRKDIGRRAL